jgi:hypothetical protein
MSAVMYVCYTNPDNDPRKCPSKLYDEPGGTRLKCRRHPDETFIEYNPEANDGLRIGGKDTGFFKDESGQAKDRRVRNPTTDLSALGGAPDRLALQAEYEALYGVEPDKRWGAATLQELITTKKSETPKEKTGD